MFTFEPPDGKRVLVTGAASTVGHAITARCVADGATVFAVDTDDEALAKLSVNMPNVHPIVCDLSKLEQIGWLPTDIDVLVNCAATLRLAPIEDHDVRVFAHILRLMLEAPFRLTRHLLPYMYSKKWGRIINISSVHGHVAAPYKAAYVSAQHGLEGLSKAIAVEAASYGVTSNTVCPSHVRSPLAERLVKDESTLYGMPRARYVDEVLLAPLAVKRTVQPEEVAELVLVLYGPASASITGSSLTIDGGWTAR